MKLLDFFRSRKRPPADAAKERLQILLAHERAGTSQPEYLPKMHRDILKVICKYVEIDEEKLSVQFENIDSVSMLEVNIELPNKPWTELTKPPRPVRKRTRGTRRKASTTVVVPEGVSPETA
ncbi:MAG: cell division topological specificity factor MinE [Rhodospirillales bacterium]|nr:cell division topological specificity factor MinE [Rhodospirillales bacterium]